MILLRAVSGQCMEQHKGFGGEKVETVRVGSTLLESGGERYKRSRVRVGGSNGSRAVWGFFRMREMVASLKAEGEESEDKERWMHAFFHVFAIRLFI